MGQERLERELMMLKGRKMQERGIGGGRGGEGNGRNGDAIK